MIKKILFWFGVFTISLLVMVRPASAETIAATLTFSPPTSGGLNWYTNSYGEAVADTPLGSCTAWFYSWSQNAGYSSPHVVSYGSTNNYYCKAYVVSSGTLSTLRNTTSFSIGPAVCGAGTYNASTNMCEFYTCPSSQNWTLNGTSCTRPDCVAPQTRDGSTGLCTSPVATCPNLLDGEPVYEGYEFVLIPDGVDPDLPMNNVCDPMDCLIAISVVASIFDLALVHKVALDLHCPNPHLPLPALPVTMQVTFTSVVAPEKVDFDAVVAAAVAVDAAKTEQARQDAYIAKVVADGIASIIAVDTAAAQAALETQRLAVAEVKRKAGEVTVDPSVTNVNNYNTAVTNYNNTVSGVSAAMTQLQNDYSVQSANRNNAQSSTTDATAIDAQVDTLKAAITASGQAFDATSVAAETAGDTALNDQLTAATTALGLAQIELTGASALSVQAAVDITAAAKSMADTAAAVGALLGGLGGLPPPTTPVDVPVTPPDAVPTPFCVDHPTDPTCIIAPEPEPVDCTVTPNAPGCISMSGTPTVGTLAVDGLYTSGALNAGKTIGDVLGTFKARMLASPVIGAASNFFTVNVGSGGCPTWSQEVPLFGTLTFDFYCQTTFQNLLPWIRSVLLLIFSVIAFRIAVL